MGSTSASTASNSRYLFDPRPWAIVGEGHNYRILRNSANGEELEEYLHTVSDSKQFDHVRNVFEYRLQKDYIVASRFFRQENRNQMCSTFFQGFVYTERIPLRMNEIRDLPFPDTLHLVNACLRGFRQLYSKTGGFDVSQHMIGINCDAKVKVWLSDDYGSARPYDEEGKDERIMVCQILQIIDKNIDRRTQPQSITQALTRNGPPTFNEALQLLNQYTVRHVISIPPCLISIAELRDKGYFKKMAPKGRSIGSITSPLQPSINRSLPIVTQSMLSSGNPNFTPTVGEFPPVNINAPIPGLLPSPQSVTLHQPITTRTTSPYEAPILSPLSVQLTQAKNNITTHNVLNNHISPLNKSNRAASPSRVQGVPHQRVNHLQYAGKQPIMNLTQKYPPPADYSPLQAPPPHLKGHKTQVRSWMHAPITREGSIQRAKTNIVSASPNIRPGTPTFAALPLSPHSINLNVPVTTPAPTFTPMTPLPSSGYISIVPPPTENMQSLNSIYDERRIQEILAEVNSLKKYDTYSSSQKQTYSNFESDLPIIIIPNKIELTVTKITNRQPEGKTTQNFVLNPNQSNIHSGLIKDILQHTIGLQGCLKDGAYYNPTISGQRIIEEYGIQDTKGTSRATTADFTDYDSPVKRRDYYEGHTDPYLLQKAVQGISTIIDSQPSSSQFDQSNFSNNYSSSYENRQENKYKSNSANVRTSLPNSTSSYLDSSNEKSSAEIMAIVSQALGGKRGASKFQNTSQMSEIESVDYDSRYGSNIR